jgi:phage terminase large subunit
MSELVLPTPKIFASLDKPARYKGAWGGRGSGKSHYFAERIILNHLTKPGFRTICIREFQNSLRESSKRLLEDKLNQFSLGESMGFTVRNDSIITPGGGIISFTGMADANAESIKSLEGYSVAWVEEAQTLSARSLALLRPTIRTENSELWFSWNARRKTDPVDALLRGAEIPSDAAVVHANWRDNPFFPSVLEQERQDCMRMQPDQYGHIWEGEYATILVGAYYAMAISQARSEGRIGRIRPDPILPIRLFFDIGGTGARSDACVIWAVQFVGKEIRWLDHYEARGQELSVHVAWMRDRGYTPREAQVYLPHDGVQQDKVYATSYESALKDAGYQVEVVKNQGAGAAKARIEALRRLFPNCWFDIERTQAGLDALGWYHERMDDTRQIGLGPEHDWASHSADAAGMAAIVAETLMRDNGWSQGSFTSIAASSGAPSGYSRQRGPNVWTQPTR